MAEVMEHLINVDDFDFTFAQDYLSTNGYTELNIVEMIKEVIAGNTNAVIVDTFSCLIRQGLGDMTSIYQLTVCLMIVGLFSAVMANMTDIFKGKSVSDTGFYVCYMAEILVLLKIFDISVIIAHSAVYKLLEYMRVMVPTFIMTVGITATSTAIAFYQIILLIFWGVDLLMGGLVLPALKIYILLSLCNNLSKEDLLSKGIDLIKGFITKINSWSIGVVGVISGLQGIVMPGVDGMKNTVLYKMAGALPVIGNQSAYLSEVFLGSGRLIKNSAGVVTILIIIMMCAVPVIKLFIVSVMLNVCGAFIQPVADKRIFSGFALVGTGISLLLKTVLSIEIIFVICVGTICLVTGG